MNRRGDSRRRVLKAARRLFARRGFAATTMGEISARASASPSSIYWHFRGGKDDILLEVLKESAGAFVDRVLDAVRDAPDLEAKCEALVNEAQRQMEQNPDTLRLIMQMALERAATDRAIRTRIRDIFERCRTTIAAELRATMPPRPDDHFTHVATVTLAVLQGLFLQWQLDPDRVDLDATFAWMWQRMRVELDQTRLD